MRTDPGSFAGIASPPALEEIRPRVDDALRAFLDEQRIELAGTGSDADRLVGEVERLVRAGGKRIRPALCYWGYRIAGGVDGAPIVRAAASLELFHTFALIHDDVMDRSTTRRGVPTTHVRFGDGDAHRGISIAVLVGDLAAVLADRMLAGSGFPAGTIAEARDAYDRMRLAVAVGQFLDVSTARPNEATAVRIAELKTGSYTVEGPLRIGVALAGGSPEVCAALDRFARPLGEAFQVRDDLAGVLMGERDLLDGRPTWILARALDRLSPESVEAFAASPEAARAALRDAGVLDDAEVAIDRWVSDAIAALDAPALAEARNARMSLAALARLVGGRS